MPKLSDKALLVAAKQILVMLIEVDELEGLSIKHLRLIQLMVEQTRQKGRCTPATLASATGWPRPTISRLLRDLASTTHGPHPAFFTFSANDKDRRLKIIQPTDAAEECRKRVLRKLKDALTR